MEQQVLASESRAINAEISLNEAQCQVEEKKKRLKIAEKKEREMEEKVYELETLVSHKALKINYGFTLL